MKNSEIRRKEAQIRQAEHDSLTASQKLTKLDLRFGGGVGAVKERAKLKLEIETEKQSKVEEVKKTEKKPYQKPKKS
jgi:hypothetical protein